MQLRDHRYARVTHPWLSGLTSSNGQNTCLPPGLHGYATSQAKCSVYNIAQSELNRSRGRFLCPSNPLPLMSLCRPFEVVHSSMH
eukprot:2171-Heterococcus_DN1.PRE.1